MGPNDILFFASVLMFSAAAVLGYWQLLRAGLEEPVADIHEPEAIPEPVPVTL
jgi:cytochrome oxidase assembly protein ShyY1